MPSPFQGGVIRELLNACRLSVTVYPQMSACGSRNLGASAAQRCIFHLVGRGSCWMQVPRRPPVRLETGDLVLLPRNAWHDLSAPPTRRSSSAGKAPPSARSSASSRTGGNGASGKNASATEPAMRRRSAPGRGQVQVSHEDGLPSIEARRRGGASRLGREGTRLANGCLDSVWIKPVLKQHPAQASRSQDGDEKRRTENRPTVHDWAALRRLIGYWPGVFWNGWMSR